MIPELPEENPNPITVTRRVTDTALVIERTPQLPITITETHSIDEARAKIAKYRDVIAIWQAKIDPLEDILLEHATLVAKDNPPK